jgi:hypothetical protein
MHDMPSPPPAGKPPGPGRPRKYTEPRVVTTLRFQKPIHAILSEAATHFGAEVTEMLEEIIRDWGERHRRSLPAEIEIPSPARKFRRTGSTRQQASKRAT